MRLWIMTQLRRWVVWWHGEGDPDQLDVYRCKACHRLVSWVMIRQGGCACGIRAKIEAFPIRWWHTARLVLLPWTVSYKIKAPAGRTSAKLKDWSKA